jgi:anti-sigma regulatory factor (Ser/Thr protein kinase)
MPGLDPAFIKRVVVSIYEAEVNMIAHANGGNIVVTVDEEKIVAVFNDVDPGIPDINLAMQKGFSTASDEVRQPGFGAAMGLPNIQKNSDKLLITTEVGKKTQVTIISYFTNQTDEL